MTGLDYTYFSLLKKKVDIPYNKVIDYVNLFSHYSKIVCIICSKDLVFVVVVVAVVVVFTF